MFFLGLEMVDYKISGSYMAAGNILSFDKHFSVTKGKVFGDDLEGRMDSSRITFKSDDMVYQFVKRFDMQDSAIYSGRVCVEGIVLGDAVASVSKKK
jgi:hypothetical protein